MIASYRWNTKYESLEDMIKNKKQSCQAHTIDIRHCSLKRLGRVVGWPVTKTLLRLHINHCGFKSLTGLDQFHGLRQLQAKYNDIGQVGTLNIMNSLQSVSLQGNPISYDRRDLIESLLNVTTQLKIINGQELEQFVKTIKLDCNQPITLETLKSQSKKQQISRTSHLLEDAVTQPSTVASKASRKSSKKFGNLIQQKQNYDISNLQPSCRTSRLHRLSSEEYLMEDPMQISSDLGMLAQLHYERTLFRKVVLGMLGCREPTFSEREPTKDWLIECFYAWKHNYEVNCAYKRRHKTMSFSGFQARTNHLTMPSHGTLPFSLDIEMINQTYDRQSSVIGSRAR